MQMRQCGDLTCAFGRDVANEIVVRDTSKGKQEAEIRIATSNEKMKMLRKGRDFEAMIAAHAEGLKG